MSVYLHVYTCTVFVSDASRPQRRVLDFRELELQIAVSWELNLGSLKEQQTLLTDDLSLQPRLYILSRAH